MSGWRPSLRQRPYRQSHFWHHGKSQVQLYKIASANIQVFCMCIVKSRICMRITFCMCITFCTCIWNMMNLSSDWQTLLNRSNYTQNSISNDFMEYNDDRIIRMMFFRKFSKDFERKFVDDKSRVSMFLSKRSLENISSNTLLPFY